MAEMNSMLKERQGGIFHFLREVKGAVFNALFVVLNEIGEEPMTLMDIVKESGVDYIQMMYFPFSPNVFHVWQADSTLSVIEGLFSRLNFSNYLPNLNYSTFLASIYFIVVLILLFVADILYVSYSFSKKKFQALWPLELLAVVAPRLVTFLFLPITETLINVLSCEFDSQSGQYVLQSYGQVQCWQGWHVLHATVAVVSGFLFVVVCSVVTLTLYQPRMKKEIINSRQNSNGDVIYILNKILINVFFSLNVISNDWFYVLLLLLLSAWLFYAYNFKNPFYNHAVSKFYRIATSYFFWTNFMLFLSLLFSYFGFTGGFIAWAAGIPFIFLYILFEQKSGIQNLSASNMKFGSAEEIDSHLKYVLELVNNRHDSQISFMLLEGYIEKHKDLCNEDDCPLKARHEADDEDTRVQLLLRQADRMYETGLKKFPTGTKLRLSYAFFLMEFMRNKDRAYEQLMKAESSNPDFNEEFIIYRFKKIIKEKLEAPGESDEDQNLLSLIFFENEVALFEEHVQAAARTLKEFWAELKEEKPNSEKLNSLGVIINDCFLQVDQHFSKLLELKLSSIEAHKVYGEFLFYVKQEPLLGLKSIRAAKKMLRERASKHSYVLADGAREHATLLLSAEKAAVGRIVRSNMKFTEITGMYENELAGSSLDKLMPNLYIEYHHERLTDFIEDQEAPGAYFGARHPGFLKAKNGYLIRVSYEVKLLAEEAQFLALFELVDEPSTCYMLADCQLNVLDVSTEFFSIMEIPKMRSVSLQDVFSQVCPKEQILKRKRLEDFFRPIRTVRFKVEVVRCRVVPEDFLRVHGKFRFEMEERVLGLIITLEQPSRTVKGKMAIPPSSMDRHAVQYLQSHFRDWNNFESEEEDEELAIEEAAENLALGVKTFRLEEGELRYIYIGNGEDQLVHEDSRAGAAEEETEYREFDSSEKFKERLKNAINFNYSFTLVTVFRLSSLLCALLVLVLVGVSFWNVLRGVEEDLSIYGNILNVTKENVYWQEQVISYIEGRPLDAQRLLARNFTTGFSLAGAFNLTGIEHILSLDEAVQGLKQFLIQTEKNKTARLQHSLVLNYVNGLQPLLGLQKEVPSTYQGRLSVGVATACLNLVIVLGLLVHWTIVVLSIQKIRLQLITWFLNVPIPKVNSLSRMVVKFLKEFETVKSLTGRGIREEDIVKPEAEREVVRRDEDQSNTRKTLVKYYRQLGICSNFKPRLFLYYGFFALLCSATLANTVTQLYQHSMYSRFQPSLASSAGWVSSLNSLQVLRTYNRQAPAPLRLPTKTVMADLSTLVANMRYIYADIGNLLNQTYSNFYFQVYYLNTCKFVAWEGCPRAFNGSFLIGLRSIHFLYNYYEQSLGQAELDAVYEKVLRPLFVQLCREGEGYMGFIGSFLTFVYTVVDTVFLVLFGVGFVVLWQAYVSQLNTELNQIIRILNMIPTEVILNSDKDVKFFIKWLIRESSLEITEQDIDGKIE